MGDWKAAFAYLRQRGHKFHEGPLRGFVEGEGWADTPATRRTLERLLTLARGMVPTEPAPRVRPGLAGEIPRARMRRSAQITPAEWLRAQTTVQALVRRANADPEVIAYRAKYLPRGEPMPINPALDHLEELPAEELEEAYAVLERVCGHLGNRFGWSVGLAQKVVLTGTAFPATSPIEASTVIESNSADYAAARIVLEVQAWVSPATVAAVYMREQMSVRRRGNRPKSEPELKKFTSADTLRMQGRGWPEIVSELGLKSGWRQLRKEVKERTERELLHPRLALPGARKPSAMKSRSSPKSAARRG